MLKEFPPDKYAVANQELDWIRKLGRRVAVEVVATTDSGYAMEELAPAPRQPDLPGRLLAFLRERVWSRDDCLGAAGVATQAWAEHAFRIFGVKPPMWVYAEADDLACCTHGDPSLSNVMVDERGELRLIDPCHRVHAPETWSVDAGKVLQSMLGWETVQAGLDPVVWTVGDDEVWQDARNLRLTLWWCGYHAVRILRREAASFRRWPVEVWAENVRDQCWGALER